jgi:hypothetical protein
MCFHPGMPCQAGWEVFSFFTVSAKKYNICITLGMSTDISKVFGFTFGYSFDHTNPWLQRYIPNGVYD